MQDIDSLKLVDSCTIKVLLFLIGENRVEEANLKKISQAAMNYGLLVCMEGRRPRMDQIREYLKQFIGHGFNECKACKSKEL